MSVDAKLVKNLRDRTGAGMMDCKKALVEAKGDVDLALDLLRKSGIAKAEKKSTKQQMQELAGLTSFLPHQRSMGKPGSHTTSL